LKNVDWATAAITAITTSVITLMGTAMIAYFVQYSLIEKPKIEIENRNSSIDTLKKIEGIAPIAHISCKTIALSDGFDWRLECAVSNKGQFGFEASIADEDVNLYNSSDLAIYDNKLVRLAGVEIKSLDSYSPNVRVQPSEEYVLFKSISIDRKTYRNGISDSVAVYPCFRIKIKESLEAEFKRIYPEMSDHIARQNPPKSCLFVALDHSKF